VEERRRRRCGKEGKDENIHRLVRMRGSVERLNGKEVVKGEFSKM